MKDNYTREDCIWDIEWLYNHRNQFTYDFLFRVSQQITNWNLLPKEEIWLEEDKDE